MRINNFIMRLISFERAREFTDIINYITIIIYFNKLYNKAYLFLK